MDDLRFKASYVFGIKFPITRDAFYTARKKLIFKYHADKAGKSDPKALHEILDLSKQVLDNLDELNKTSSVYFSQEQIDYLRTILTPYCCHIIGHHHTYMDICSEQKADAYDRLCKILGIKINKSVKRPGCTHC